MNPQSSLQREEETKREAAWDPRQRWRLIQETITWASEQAAVPRNTPQGCLATARRHLAYRNRTTD